jgi:hypothetical protein
MIRAVAVVSLVLLLVLGLYIPSVQTPAHVLDTLRQEHAEAAAFWGETRAEQVLERALAMQAGAAEASPLPAARDPPRSLGTNAAVAAEMASVNQRLFHNAYFRSVDAVLMRASYRLAARVRHQTPTFRLLAMPRCFQSMTWKRCRRIYVVAIHLTNGVGND